MSEPLPPRAVRKALSRRRRHRAGVRGFLLLTLALGVPIFLIPGAGGIAGTAPLGDLVPAALAVVALLYVLLMSREGAASSSRPLHAASELPVTGTGRVTIVPVVRPRRRGAGASALQLRAHRVQVAPYLLEAVRRGESALGPGYGAREGGSVWHPPAGVVGIAVVERPGERREGAEAPVAPAGDAPPPVAAAAPPPVAAAPPSVAAAAPAPEAAGPEEAAGEDIHARAFAEAAATPVAPAPAEEAATPAAPAPEAAWPFWLRPPEAGEAARGAGEPGVGPGEAAAEPPAAAAEPPAAAAGASGPGDGDAATIEPAEGTAPGAWAAPFAAAPPAAAEPVLAPPRTPAADGALPVQAMPPPPRRHLSRLAQRGTVLGIDIGSYSTKIVQVRLRRRGRFDVVNFWEVRNPAGSIAGGAVVKPQLLASRLAPVVDDYRLDRRPAVSSLSIQKAMTKIARFPRMSREEIANALRWEAENYVPLPLETSVVDFAVGPFPAGEGEGGEMEVLVVAAPREAVEALAAALEGAGVAPVAVEIESLAAYRALRALGLVPSEEEEEEEGCTVLLDLGHSASRLSVFKRGLPVVNRAMKTGGRDFTEAVARGLGFTVERAEAAVRRWGVRPGTPIHALVAPVLDALTADIWRSIEFFLVLSKADRVDRVFLTGGNALQPGLAETLDRYLVGRLSERFDQVPSEAALVRLVAPGSLLRLPRHLKPLAPELDARFVGALGTALWRG